MRARTHARTHAHATRSQATQTQPLAHAHCLEQGRRYTATTSWDGGARGGGGVCGNRVSAAADIPANGSIIIILGIFYYYFCYDIAIVEPRDRPLDVGIDCLDPWFFIFTSVLGICVDR